MLSSYHTVINLIYRALDFPVFFLLQDPSDDSTLKICTGYYSPPYRASQSRSHVEGIPIDASSEYPKVDSTNARMGWVWVGL